MTPPASATLGDDSDQWRRQMDRQTQRGGQRDIGVAVATPGPLSMRRPSTLGFKKQDLPGNNERAGEDMTRGPGRHPNEIDEGAHNEGSVDNDAVAARDALTAPADRKMVWPREMRWPLLLIARWYGRARCAGRSC